MVLEGLERKAFRVAALSSRYILPNYFSDDFQLLRSLLNFSARPSLKSCLRRQAARELAAIAVVPVAVLE
jgi:hypothetical protein